MVIINRGIQGIGMISIGSILILLSFLKIMLNPIFLLIDITIEMIIMIEEIDGGIKGTDQIIDVINITIKTGGTIMIGKRSILIWMSLQKKLKRKLR